MGSLGTCCHILPIKNSSCLPSCFVGVLARGGASCVTHSRKDAHPEVLISTLMKLGSSSPHPASTACSPNCSITSRTRFPGSETQTSMWRKMSLSPKQSAFIKFIEVSEGKDALIQHTLMLLIYQVLHILHFLINLTSFDIGFSPSCSQKFPTVMGWKSQWTSILFAIVYS